jgi:hypothetical protein
MQSRKMLSRGRSDLQRTERLLQRQLHGRHVRVWISRRELHGRLRLLRGLRVRLGQMREPRRRDVRRAHAVRERQLRRGHLRCEGRRSALRGFERVRRGERVPRRQMLSRGRRGVQRAFRLLQRIVQSRFVRMPLIVVLLFAALTRDGINPVIAQHASELRVCYLDAVQRAPGLEGRLDVRFDIAGDGTTKNIAVLPSSTVSNGRLSTCVVSVFSKLVFAKDAAVTGVVYPVHFGRN